MLLHPPFLNSIPSPRGAASGWKGGPNRIDEEIARARLTMAELLLARFEEAPSRHAADGIEAALQLMGCGERERALEVLLRVGQLLGRSSASLSDRGRAEPFSGRPLLDEPSARTGAVRRSLAMYERGDMLGARALLAELQRKLELKSDFAKITVVAYYLGRSLLALGDLDGAFAMSQRVLKFGQGACGAGVMARAQVFSAEVLLASFQPAAARILAEVALRAPEQKLGVRVAASYVLAKASALHRDMPAAWEALEQAADAYDAIRTVDREREHDIEYAELYVLSGSVSSRPVEDVICRAERAQRYYAACPGSYKEARAALALTAALLIGWDRGRQGKASDLDRALESLCRAQELCSRYAYGLLHLRCVLLDAALQQAHGFRRRAQGLIAQGLDSASLTEDSLELRLLRAAYQESGVDGEKDDETGSPAVGVILSWLGLRTTLVYEIIDRSGRRDGDESERQRAFSTHDLVIEPERGVIARGGGGTLISGRPLMAGLLAALLSTPESGVSAERLFYEVWGGKEYQPLRHRNTIYVAIGRLRQALRDLLPGREVIETSANGWRLASDIDLCAIRSKRNNV
jgi:DNA-binding winged helix-turn-helix (wHTH) protein